MKQIHYHPKTTLKKFGEKIFNLLVDNFPQTFFVGGMVRDLLLNKKIIDIDIATKARPEEVMKILADGDIKFNSSHKQFGVIIAKNGRNNIEITTFRKDTYKGSRYPKITFANDPKTDSQRRDFTINALYLSPKSNTILDFHKGLKDIGGRQIKFIGQPSKRIKEDPLRIIRALRFALQLNFKIETKTFYAIKNNFNLINTLTESKKNFEIKKLKSKKQKNHLLNFLRGKKLLTNLLFNFKINLDS